jgi:hypothetical protein
MPTSSSNNYSNLQEGNSKIISDITTLQAIEKGLFDTLEKNLNQNVLTQPQKESLIQKINEISKMRENMYQTIGGINNFYQSNIVSSSTSLAQQTAAISIVEKELNAAKERLKKIEEYKLQKLRLVEINNYYSERYAAHTQIMKIIIYMFVPILVLTILAKKGILPRALFFILTIIIGAIGSVYLLYAVYSTYARNNMLYQEYDWGFDPNTAPKTPTSISGSASIDPWAKKDVSDICIGQACCDVGYIHDPIQNKCILSTTISGRKN